MPRASTFIFGPYTLNTEASRVTFSYRAALVDGSVVEYVDQLDFLGMTREAWERVPASLLTGLLQDLSLALGVNYWKLHPAREMRIEGFALDEQQARFWNEFYTKGLMEFFYRAQIDFRGLVSFPHDARAAVRTATRVQPSSRALLMNGGGKDSIVSAEMLKERGISFDLFTVNETGAHRRVAEEMGRSRVLVRRTQDPASLELMRRMKMHWIYPTLSTYTFMAVLVAALSDYGFIFLSNEKSADAGNARYLGEELNHQWCKSSEAEKLINDYIARYVTPDIQIHSLLRAFSELEITRRFSAYPQYFHLSSSCNEYFFLKRDVQAAQTRAYWCKTCPKCTFLFACFSAFIPKPVLVDMFGADLYADESLIPTYRRLLGIEGTKPLECVGEPEEAIVAMHLAAKTHAYDGEPVMQMFVSRFPASPTLKDMEARVLPPLG